MPVRDWPTGMALHLGASSGRARDSRSPMQRDLVGVKVEAMGKEE